MLMEKMHILPLFLIVAMLFIGFIPSASQMALAISIVHGNVYEWSSFDTLNDSQVYVNSVPQQVMISKNGSYSFDLDKGIYTIVATYGTNTSDSLMAMENVTIDQDGGDYVIDLVLFPSSNFGDLALLDENSTPIVSIAPVDLPTQQSSQGTPVIYIIGVIGIVIIIAGAGAFLYLRKRSVQVPKPDNSIPETQAAKEDAPLMMETQAVQEPEAPLPPLPPTASTDVSLPDDLREVIRIIEKSGGRITQLDLRKALPYSEAKVSLMITDLENRGIVKKIKKGRGNVLILNRPDERPPN